MIFIEAKNIIIDFYHAFARFEKYKLLTVWIRAIIRTRIETAL